MKSKDEIKQAIGKENTDLFALKFGSNFIEMFDDYYVDENGETQLHLTKVGQAISVYFELANSEDYCKLFDESIAPQELIEVFIAIMGFAVKYCSSATVLMFMQTGLDRFKRAKLWLTKDLKENGISYNDVFKVLKDANKAQLRLWIDSIDQDMANNGFKNKAKAIKVRQAIVTAMVARTDKDIFKALDKAKTLVDDFIESETRGVK
jgi:hypothetical protein